MKNYRPGWLSLLLSKFKIAIILLLISGLVYQCRAALYIPVSIDAEKAKTTLDTLLAGRNLYIEHCSSCHNLRLPYKYTAIRWKENIDKMQIKAKIDDEQKAIILKYLTAKCRE
jgi:mono/diheme cytochrome c family protein